MTKAKIGVGVIIFKKNHVLLGKRTNSHGHNTWAFPGGHLELGETPKQCAIREIMEETGLSLDKTLIVEGPWVHDLSETKSKHYVTLFMLATHTKSKPKVLEPNKCLEWKWFHIKSLPTPLMTPIQKLLKNTSLKKLQNQLTLASKKN